MFQSISLVKTTEVKNEVRVLIESLAVAKNFPMSGLKGRIRDITRHPQRQQKLHVLSSLPVIRRSDKKPT